MQSSQDADIATVRDVFAAINRGDFSGFLKVFDPEIIRIEPEGYSKGTYRGSAEVKAHFVKSRDTWAEGACEPEKIVVAGDKIIAFTHVRVRLKKNMEWVEGRVAEVFSLRNGRIIEMRLFADGQQAMEWCGVKE